MVLVFNPESELLIPRTENQAKCLAQYAKNFLSCRYSLPNQVVLAKVNLFHLDSVACAISAITNASQAPKILRNEALGYIVPNDGNGATIFGDSRRFKPEKAVLANVSAVRELDANGTNFGYNERFGHIAGEYGHNDYYPVVVAACQIMNYDGLKAILGMLLLDEIRGRLCESFSLRKLDLDHTFFGAIAASCVYCALLNGSVEQIESAIGLVSSHFVPYRSIRAGAILSDSKGASAAFSSEVAVICAQRALDGFLGPLDIFRNPSSPFAHSDPFDLIMTYSGSDFAIMSMHFKLGLYEHQSASAIEALFHLFLNHKQILDLSIIKSIEVLAYKDALAIIGDPSKRFPQSRQTADHSMFYLIGTVLRKASEIGSARLAGDIDGMWKQLILLPEDYNEMSLKNPITKDIISKIQFGHGGKHYDALYPRGIPTSIKINTLNESFFSGIIEFPAGHCLNTHCKLNDLLDFKHMSLMNNSQIVAQIRNLETKTQVEIQNLYDFHLETKEA